MQLAYQQEGKRDLRLDWLRGYALFAMSINHAIPESLFHIITGGSAFLISAAEMFLFISGYTIGFISHGREVKTALSRMWKRVWIVYLATIGIAFGFAALSLSTDLILWGEFEINTYGELLPWAGSVLLLLDQFHGSDILIAYVVYLALAPLVIYGLLKGKTKLVLGLALAIYILSQFFNNATELPFASFRHLAANNLLFFGAMVLGYHRHALTNWWKHFRLRRILDALVIGLGVLLLVGYITDFAWFPMAGDVLETYDLGIREFMMPVGPLLVVLLYVRLFFILITELWVPLNKSLGWLMLPLGQASLFTFTMHLVAIPLLYLIPGADLAEEDILLATLAGTYYMALIFGAVKLRQFLRTRAYDSTLVGRAFLKRIHYIHAGIAAALFLGATLLFAEPNWDDLELNISEVWFEEEAFED